MSENTLKKLAEMSDADVDTLHLGEVVELEKLLASEYEALDKLSKKLYASQVRRYEPMAKRALGEQKKNFGTRTFETNMGFKVKVELPKKVEWDQEKARAAVDRLANMGKNVNEFVSFDVKISEAKFNAWENEIKKLFEPARTEKPQKTKVTIIPDNNEG